MEQISNFCTSALSMQSDALAFQIVPVVLSLKEMWRHRAEKWKNLRFAQYKFLVLEIRPSGYRHFGTPSVNSH